MAHQANNLRLRRTPESYDNTIRRRWEPKEEYVAEQLYEAGTPVTVVALNVNRTDTAVRQRWWQNGWQRPHSTQGMAATEFSGGDQNPEDSKSITSGLVFGG